MVRGKRTDRSKRRGKGKVMLRGTMSGEERGKKGDEERQHRMSLGDKEMGEDKKVLKQLKGRKKD